MAMRLTCVALIPARSGSKRVTAKNIRPLAGHPLLAYTIAAAREAGTFDRIVVSTDSEAHADVARYYGAEVPFLRPAALAGDLSPDIDWIEFTLRSLADSGARFECFSILRPTSPFRQASTIQRAFNQFVDDPAADSLRAVEPCRQHPGKMWIVRGRRMTPLLPFTAGQQPWHSNQYQALPVVHVQNASLEIARSRVIFESRTIAGDVVMPFFTEGYEGFDINRPEDWAAAELLVASGAATLPVVTSASYAAVGHGEGRP
jgi:N-acylneuraminate cytidylyltransferase